VADEGVPTRDIASVIGRRLGVPLVTEPQAAADHHFGFLGLFLSLDAPASSALTRRQLDWRPVESGLLADIDSDHYFAK
jgi:hypothetical protein